MTDRRTAPKHLKWATQRWWLHVVNTWELEEHHRRLATLAGEAWDRGRQAREVLAEEGLTYEDRYGAPHPRPEVAIEKDSSIRYARLIRELDLDVEPPREAARPPSLRAFNAS